MENRAHNVSKKALKLNKVLAMVSAFAIGLGAFCVPMTAFADVGGSTVNEYVFEYGDYSYSTFSTVDGSSWNSSDFMSGTISLPVDYTLFRVYVKLPDSIPSGADVDVFIKYATGPGSLSGSGCAWLGTFYGTDVGSQAQYSDIVWSWWDTYETSFAGLYPSQISSDVMFQFSYNPRSSTSFYFRITEIIVRVDSVLNLDGGSSSDKKLGLLNQLTGNILEDVKIIGMYLLDLPSYISEGLADFFDSVKNAVNNVGTGITNLPGNIKSALTSLFANLQTAVGNVSSGVVNGLSGFFSNVQNAVNFVGAGVDSFLDDFQEWRENNGRMFMEEMSKAYAKLEAMTGEDNAMVRELKRLIGDVLEQDPNYSEIVKDNSSDLDSLLGDIDSLNKPNVDEFPSIEDYAPDVGNPIMIVLRRLFTLEIVQTMAMVGLVFGFVGYVLFGKR